MKTINLKGVLEILSEKELKNVIGGYPGSYFSCACKNGRAKAPYRSSWSAYYGNATEMADDIGKMCELGGGCINISGGQLAADPIYETQVSSGAIDGGSVTWKYIRFTLLHCQ
ncbi:hypothetical protein FACS1894145_5960 [Bacteroidia bacterium]|nr:hypothetical protein FACS1894145_5960 [Bacteroidia bacterium]